MVGEHRPGRFEISETAAGAYLEYSGNSQMVMGSINHKLQGSIIGALRKTADGTGASLEYFEIPQMALEYLWSIWNFRRWHWSIFGVFKNFANGTGVSLEYFWVSFDHVWTIFGIFSKRVTSAGYFWSIFENVKSAGNIF